MSGSSISPEGYLPRIVDEQVERFLKLFGAVEIAGAKWSGKTWTACAHGASITYIDEGNNYDLASSDPLFATLGERPHVIDEWQRVPAIWDTVRHEVDRSRGLRGAWILTGSSSPGRERPSHSGAGRIGRVRMMPMTLAESGDSTAGVSLAGLFEGEFAPCIAPRDSQRLVELACRGGWPETIEDDAASALDIAREYLRAFYTESVPREGKNPTTAQRLVSSVARNLGQAATHATLMADMHGGDATAAHVDDKTLADYLDLLERHYLVRSIPGWAPPARSPRRVRTKPKRYFSDPSLAVAALGMSPSSLLEDWQTFGLVFENMCMRDLEVYARALPGAGIEPVRYYRDDSNLEADAIIELDDGRWAAIEAKVSEDKVPKAVSSLKRLRKKLCSNPGARTREPEFMAVVVGICEYAHEVEEGIYVIPIRALGR